MLVNLCDDQHRSFIRCAIRIHPLSKSGAPWAAPWWQKASSFPLLQPLEASKDTLFNGRGHANVFQNGNKHDLTSFRTTNAMAEVRLYARQNLPPTLFCRARTFELLGLVRSTNRIWAQKYAWACSSAHFLCSLLRHHGVSSRYQNRLLQGLRQKVHLFKWTDRWLWWSLCCCSFQRR